MNIFWKFSVGTSEVHQISTLKFLIRVLYFLIFYGIFSYLHGLLRTYTFIYLWGKLEPTQIHSFLRNKYMKKIPTYTVIRNSSESNKIVRLLFNFSFKFIFILIEVPGSIFPTNIPFDLSKLCFIKCHKLLWKWPHYQKTSL